MLQTPKLAATSSLYLELAPVPSQSTHYRKSRLAHQTSEAWLSDLLGPQQPGLDHVHWQIHNSHLFRPSANLLWGYYRQAW